MLGQTGKRASDVVIGENLKDLCKEQQSKITNEYFMHKQIFKYTWTHQTRNSQL